MKYKAIKSWFHGTWRTCMEHLWLGSLLLSPLVDWRHRWRTLRHAMW